METQFQNKTLVQISNEYLEYSRSVKKYIGETFCKDIKSLMEKHKLGNTLIKFLWEENTEWVDIKIEEFYFYDFIDSDIEELIEDAEYTGRPQSYNKDLNRIKSFLIALKKYFESTKIDQGVLECLFNGYLDALFEPLDGINFLLQEEY